MVGDLLPTERWAPVHRQLQRAREALDEARDPEEFQAVGVLCREAMISLAQAVYVAERHPTLDAVKPSKSDAKRMLDAFIAREHGGATNKEARKVALASVDFANNLQHHRTADYDRAAMCVTATASVIQFVSVIARKGDSRSSVAQLCNRFITEVQPKGSHGDVLRVIARSELGKKVAADLQDHDIVAYCRVLRQKLKAPTVNQYVTFLRGVLLKAREDWGLNVSPGVIDRIRPELERTGLCGRSVPRTRLPTTEELDRLTEYFRRQNEHHRTEIDMVAVAEFARWTARRIGEICRLRWADLDREKRTCVVRAIQTPKTKALRDHEFPLLGKAWDIVQSQPEGDERIFPYKPKCASQRYTRALRHLGIKNLRFDDLRREAARHLLREGYSLEDIFKVVGRLDVTPLLRELGLSAAPAAGMPLGRKPLPPQSVVPGGGVA